MPQIVWKQLFVQIYMQMQMAQMAVGLNQPYPPICRKKACLNRCPQPTQPTVFGTMIEAAEQVS